MDPEAINATLPHFRLTQELSTVSTTSNCWEYMSTQLCLGQNMLSTSQRRLYFLKVLKRAGLPPHHLLHYYAAVIWPVLEYCSCIWHHNITNKLSLQIEAIQKRAIKIIFQCTRHMSYANSLYLTELSSLQHRRQQQARDFFRSLFDHNSCLHSLLPTPRDPNLVATLRAARRFRHWLLEQKNTSQLLFFLWNAGRLLSTNKAFNHIK